MALKLANVGRLVVSPVVGDQDIFEGLYTEKFKSLARAQGEFVLYERDRAAIDIGVHLTEPTERGRSICQSRVWFQLKGIRASTLSREEYAQADKISLSIPLNHLKFWFASPEPIYLVVYVESADEFLLEDVREIVHRQWGERIFAKERFHDDQKEVTVRIWKNAILTPNTWDAMRRHRSMRVDGPLFRGRPLGHRLDPLRCQLKELDAATFCGVIARLLDLHGYEKVEKLDAARLFANDNIQAQYAVLTRGSLYQTLEWVLQLTTEIGIGPDNDFRGEGPPVYAQGPCAVFIHGNPRSRPDRESLQEFARYLLKQGIRRLLVFANLRDSRYFGAFFSGMRGTGVECLPQLLGEIAYHLLTVTAVYLEYRHAVSWKHVNYL